MNYGTALALYDVTIPEHLAADAEVPVLTGPQRQGDVGIFPRPALGKAEAAKAIDVPAAGIQVMRGENGGNTHWLHAPGCRWIAGPGGESLVLGVLEVPAGAEAHLIHTDEHGANAMGPGCYTMRGKREQADVVRRVAD